MKYKVGDRVKIKSNDFFNKNKDKLSFYVDSMALCFANEIVTIKSHGRHPNTYRILEDEGDFLWMEEMIEGLVEEEMPLDKAAQITDFEYEGLAYTLPEGYIFKDENGNVINATKIVLEKKKKEYPKTYEECCEILDVCSGETLHYGYLPIATDYEFNLYKLLENFRKLLICRDAYWKIAGEEMGLGKSWEPDWSDDNAKYSIYTIKGALTKAISCYDGAILTFSTEEMRDAFYENFKELIEICKELL